MIQIVLHDGRIIENDPKIGRNFAHMNQIVKQLSETGRYRVSCKNKRLTVYPRQIAYIAEHSRLTSEKARK